MQGGAVSRPHQRKAATMAGGGLGRKCYPDLSGPQWRFRGSCSGMQCFIIAFPYPNSRKVYPNYRFDRTKFCPIIFYCYLCRRNDLNDTNMKKRFLFFFLLIPSFTMAQQRIIQTAGREQLGTFAPEFAHLNDDILFGEVWSRNDLLSLRDRSLVTLTALISQGITDNSLIFHLQEAKRNGITRTEISEIITHIAFYAGWPKAWAAFRMAKDVWAEPDAAQTPREAFQQTMLFPIGAPNDAYAQYFTGQSYLSPVSDAQVKIVNVTFEPGCRNHWHIHHATEGGGQVLVCVAGRGWYQEWGKEPQPLMPGDVVNIPAGVKHWHGAADDSWFAHLAIEVQGKETWTEWLEKP